MFINEKLILYRLNDLHIIYRNKLKSFSFSKFEKENSLKTSKELLWKFTQNFFKTEISNIF